MAASKMNSVEKKFMKNWSATFNYCLIARHLVQR